MKKSVTLLIDEVYTANRVDYQNGTYVCLTKDDACAKTVLTFMVQSVCKNYKDAFYLVPAEKLETSLLH